MLKDVKNVEDCEIGNYLFILFRRSRGRFSEAFISKVIDDNIFKNTLVLKDIKNFTNPEDINQEWYCNFNSEFKVIKKIKKENIENFEEKFPQYFI